MLVEGQLVGGLAQGLGGALSEEFVYDDRGEPLSTTFADYLVLTAREVPAVDVLLTEDAPAPAQPARPQGRRRRRRQRGRRCDRGRDRRRHRAAGRSDAAAGDAGQVAGAAAELSTSIGLILCGFATVPKLAKILNLGQSALSLHQPG